MDLIKKRKELEIYFQNVDYKEIKVIEGDVSLRSFIVGMLSYHPWWIAFLFQIRKSLVFFLGLVRHEKPNLLSSLNAESLSFEPGENAAFFIVRDAKEDVYWVAETPKDKHLKAFFGVAVEKLSETRARYHVFTTVKRLHWTGSLYFNLIRPFHHIIVNSMMKAGAKGCQATQ